MFRRLRQREGGRDDASHILIPLDCANQQDAEFQEEGKDDRVENKRHILKVLVEGVLEECSTHRGRIGSKIDLQFTRQAGICS